MPDRYDVFAVDGELKDLFDEYTAPCLRFNDLTWEEAVELCRLSFARGFVCVVWQAGAGGKEGA